MSVLDAFLTVSRAAQSSFGTGTPQSGAPLFESSAAVRAIENDMASTMPGDKWTGPASGAYAQANGKHIGNIQAFAALDHRFGSLIDSAASVVTGGRQDLVTVHKQVVGLADLVPRGPLRELMLLPIVNAGIGQIGGIVIRTTSDLGSIGEDITKISDEYRKLGGGEGTGPAPDEDPRKKLEEILREYQVKDDRMLPKWLLDKIGSIFGDGAKGDANLTLSEYRALAELVATKGPLAPKDFYDIKKAAEDEAIEKFPPPAPGATSDNLSDAFRHTYWNALMTQRFGEEWTRKFATSHERRPGDPAPREAMDLYNNEIGRQIALAHPDASPAELADLVQAAVLNGDTVIVSDDGYGLKPSAQGATAGNPDKPADPPPVKPPAPPGNPTPYPTEGRTPGVPA